MQDAGSAIMGIGRATGDRRAIDAATRAINSPLLDLSIDGAKGVLFSVAGGPDLTMWEVNEAARVITQPIAKEAKVIFGAVNDERLRKGEIKITVIATGFPGLEGTAPSSQSLFSVKPRIKEESPRTPLDKSQQNLPKRDSEVEDDTQWDAVPAFLRRQKK